MEIYPAIDIKGGQVVRLTQGDYDRVEVYASNPAEIAQQFLEKGAHNLHMVDLDGARDGRPVNQEVIRRVAQQKGLFTELGGGIRDEARIDAYLSMGIDRVILGTIAVKDFSFTKKIAVKYGASIAVGVDAKDGLVAVNGWLETTALDSVEFCKRLAAAGVQTIIYTDIARDGMGMGTNLDIYRTLAEQVPCNIIASGGITALEEFAELRRIGTYGAIVGKALYTGALKLEEVLAC